MLRTAALSVTLLNLFAAYTHKNYRLALHVRNLTDETYAPWSDVFYPDQVALGAPRTEFSGNLLNALMVASMSPPYIGMMAKIPEKAEHYRRYRDS